MAPAAYFMLYDYPDEAVFLDFLNQEIEFSPLPVDKNLIAGITSSEEFNFYLKFPWGADKLLLETGCLCLTQGYMTSARVGGRPQRRGYCYLSQDLRDGAWVTDLNSVDWHWYDVDEETRSQ